MKRLPARVLEQEDVRRLTKHASRRRHPIRDKAIILLSFKCGLRACEIAGLTWLMVLRSDNKVADTLTISKHIAKYGSGRCIPLHPDLIDILTRLHKMLGNPRNGPVISSERGGHMSARSIVNWFHRIYAELDLIGCSSHSGRRTFITRSARAIAKVGGSLRDVQELVGHRSLSTTQSYIAGHREAQRKLIHLI